MLAIDHIVIAAKDPKKKAEAFAKENNITVIQGGKHNNWGTYNYLAYFSNNSYIEWLGIFDEQIAKQSTNPLIKQLVYTLSSNKEGFFQYALRTKNIGKYVDHFKKSDISFIGPISGSRQKTDGKLLTWQMLFPAAKLTHILPFLIEWGKLPNVPDDPSFINEKQLQTIYFNETSKEIFNDIFKTTAIDQTINLYNGTLHTYSEQRLKFILT